MTSGTSHSACSRRGFLGTTFAAGVLLMTQPSTVRASAEGGDVTLSADGIRVTASPGGRVAVFDGQNVLRMQGSKFQIKDSIAGVQLSTGGTPSLINLADGTAAIRMDYTMPAGAVTAYGLFWVTTSHLHLEWHVDGPSTLLPDGILFSRAIQGASEVDSYVPITEWVHDAGGGIPYEESVGVAHVSTWGELHGMLLLERSRQSWTNTTWVHAPGVVQADQSILSMADLFLTAERPQAGASIGTSRDLGIELWTDQPFNLWKSSGSMVVKVQVANGSATDRSVVLDWWVKDFNGQALASRTITATVPARSTWDQSFSFTGPDYGIVTTEVTASAGPDEAFARTNLTVLPAKQFQPDAASMFGIANYPWLPKPSVPDLLDLWEQVGINWVRISYAGGPGLPPSEFDARGIQHNIELQPSLTVSDADATAWAVANTAKAIAAGAQYFEVGNELNRPFNTGEAAQAYIDKALRPVHDQIAASGASIKILNNGLAGMDKPWLENFHAGGGWDLIDGFAYHPGRGNFTADYIPGDEDWEAGSTGKYWNFYGGLRQLKSMMAQYGPKEIWLTEAYACTRPNGWWNDTYRHAAENVLLTLALAKAEGVRVVCWYQFHDSVLGMPQVANPDNVEYHFGLMNRDLSAKPSLLAYATAAGVFDHADFLGWLDFDNPQTNGLLFDTPEGDLAVLWNRADGYLLNTNHTVDSWHFPAPEVWIDPWPTKTKLSVSAAGSTVTQLDCIGQTTLLPVTKHHAGLTLDGAPRLFRGLNLRDRLSKRQRGQGGGPGGGRR